jgi:fucose permease
VIVALGIAVAFGFSRVRLEDDKPDRRDKANRSMAFVRNRTFLILAGMMFFYLCAEYSINGWLVTYLQNKPELAAQFAAQASGAGAALAAYSQKMATLFWCVMLVGRLASAALTRKLTQKRLMLLDSAGVICCFALLLVSDRIILVTAAVAGLGFCMAGICPMIYSDASYITNRYPMGTSTLLAAGALGAILMPGLVGVLADSCGFTGGMSAILAGMAALLILAFFNDRLKPVPVEDGGTSAGGCPPCGT